MSMDRETLKKELANTLTHFAGILLFLGLIPFLINRCLQKEHLPYLWAVVVFIFGLMMVYTSSTLYHHVKNPDIKKTLRIWDHISIYFLIGGTYTPLVAKFLPEPTTFLVVLWSLITVGVIFKLFFTGKFEIVSTLSYIALGWMAAFIFKPFTLYAPSPVLWLIVAGGLCYTTGVIFYVWKGYRYHHAVWHVFVLGGSLSHFLAIQTAFS